MILKQLITILFIILISVNTYAQQITLQMNGSNDSDGLNILKTSLYLTHNPSINYISAISIAHTDIRIFDDNIKYNGTREAIMINLLSNNTKLDIDVGGVFLNNNTYLTGDITLTHNFNDYYILTLSTINDFVDNDISIRNRIYHTTYLANLDYEKNRWFASGTIGTSFYSNDNRRDFIRLKLGYILFPEIGLSSYIRTYNYQNSEPNQIYYFDPDKYNRYLIGVQFRKIIYDTILTAHIDGGTQIVDNKNNFSYSFHIGAKRFITDNLAIDGRIESHQFEPDYRYSSFNIRLIYYF